MKDSLAQILVVNLVQSPNKYLGLDFMLRGKRIADFQFLVEKMSSKLQRWKAKLLSQAGRTTLIKSTLQSLPIPSIASRCLKPFVTRWMLLLELTSGDMNLGKKRCN